MMFGLPFLVVISILILARVALGFYVWWSFRRLKGRVQELERKP